MKDDYAELLHHDTVLLSEVERFLPSHTSRLGEEALYGLAGETVRKMLPETEADPAALLGELLVRFGCFIGHTAYVQHESTRHYANLFLVKVGVSSKARKGTASDRIAALFGHEKCSARYWQQKQTIYGLSSGEGLIARLRDDLPDVDKRLLVREGEFGGFLEVIRRDGNTLSAVTRNAWDSKVLEITTKSNSMRATDAHVSIIADITLAELKTALSIASRFNGFSNRFLWLDVHRSKLLPFGGVELDFSKEVTRLSAMADFARLQARVFMTEAARKMWGRMYEFLSRESADGLVFEAATSRAEAQVQRLALIYAMLDKSSHIDSDHLRAALAFWQFAEDSARFIFGGLTKEQNAILEFLKLAPRTKTEVYSDLFQRHRLSKEIDTDVKALIRAGKIRERKEGNTIYLASADFRI